MIKVKRDEAVGISFSAFQLFSFSAFWLLGFFSLRSRAGEQHRNTYLGTYLAVGGKTPAVKHKFTVCK